MRVPLNRIEKLTGVAVLIAGAVLACWLVLASRQAISGLLRGTSLYYVVATTGMGTNVGSPVMLYDVEVGRVSEVTLIDEPSFPGKRVRFTMRIDERAARMLHEGTEVVIGAGMPPFGTGSVELRPAGTGLLRPGATLVALEQPSLLHVLSKDASAFKDQLARVLDLAEAVVKNIHGLTEGLKSGKGLAGRVLSDDQMANDVTASVDDVRRLLVSVDKLVATANKTVDSGPVLMNNAVRASGEADKALVRINAAMEAVPLIVNALQQTIGELQQLLATLKIAASYAPELARKADSSIGEAQRLVEALQKNFLIRGNVPARPQARTESASRPSLTAPVPRPRASASASAALPEGPLP